MISRLAILITEFFFLLRFKDKFFVLRNQFTRHRWFIGINDPICRNFFFPDEFAAESLYNQKLIDNVSCGFACFKPFLFFLLILSRTSSQTCLSNCCKLLTSEAQTQIFPICSATKIFTCSKLEFYEEAREQVY